MPSQTMTQTSIKSFVASESARLGIEDADRTFEYVSAQSVLKPYGLDDDETVRGLVGGGNDGGYDGIFVFLNDSLISGEDPGAVPLEKRAHVDIHFIQAKNTRRLGESIFQKWQASFDNLIKGVASNASRYSPDLIEAFDLIRFVLSKSLELKLDVRMTFWVVSIAEGVLHPNVCKALEDCKETVARCLPGNVRLEFIAVGAEGLFDLILIQPDSSKTLRGTKEPLCPDESSAILTVSLSEFNDFISMPNGELDRTLFEANIRDYQGKTMVNRSIRETLEEDEGTDFWWLNNGVTIIADAMTRDMNNAICLENPRIVNGLQTSNMINEYCQSRGCAGDRRKVLVKCIASQDQAVRAKVIAATNSQTVIPSAYLRAMDSVQLKIERYFQEHGLHYDRRKNSCRNEGVKPQDIIAIPFMGQCLIATLLQQPDYARARPSQVLDDDGKYESIFNETISLDAYLSLGRLALEVRRRLNESDYSERLRNNILFYVMLAICVKQAGHFEITAEDLADLPAPSKTEIDATAEEVREVFEGLGGSDKVAKSRGMVQALRAELGY